MATYEKGVLGPFNGLVGTVVGSSWKGMNIMRSRNKKSTKEPTLKQLMQQAKFAFMIRFIAPLAELLEKTFDSPLGQVFPIKSLNPNVNTVGSLPILIGTG